MSDRNVLAVIILATGQQTMTSITWLGCGIHMALVQCIHSVHPL